MRGCGRLFILTLVFFVSSNSILLASDAVWQWSVPLREGRDETGNVRAFLWIPEECRQLQGIIVAQHNMEEISILEHPTFRDEMRKLNFGEIWIAPLLHRRDRFDFDGGNLLREILYDLSEISGYTEIQHVPLVGMGHSAAASFPYYLAAWNPKKTLAVLSVSGQWPYFRHEQFAPDTWGDRNVDHIPLLVTMGEYEAAEGFAKTGVQERSEHPNMPLSMLACPAEGHFATTNEKVDFLAFYVRKAVELRIEKHATIDAPAKLKTIDPTNTGWLSERWMRNKAPSVPAAPVKDFQGDANQAFWFFDEETVQKVEAHQKRHRGKKGQLVGYTQNGKPVEQENTHQQVDLKFEPEEDGISFNVSGFFYETVPEVSNRLRGWVHQEPGTAVGHAESGAIMIEKIYGPVAKTGDETWQLRFDRTGFVKNQAWLVASHFGDENYRPAMQQSRLLFPLRNESGIEQTIRFSEIPDQTSEVKSIPLEATATSGLPVRFYVQDGPAIVSMKQQQDGSIRSELILTPIPPRSKLPIQITVVAWQYGRPTAPFVQSAAPVTKTIFLENLDK